MKTLHTKNKLTVFFSTFILVFFAIAIQSCGESDDNTNKKLPDTVKVEKKFESKIMYSMPAPSDIASMLIDDPALKFNSEIVNPTGNIDNYTSNKSMALNLGIYTADLTYASFFNKQQISKNYFEVTKKIADKLDITNEASEKHAKRISEKKINKKEMMNIINDSFMETDAYLQENGRQDIMTMILLGGWIEAEYIATSFTKGSPKHHPELTQRILDQGISVELMSKILEDTNGDKYLGELKIDIEKIKKVYDKLFEKVTDEDFNELCLLIENIRNKYTV